MLRRGGANMILYLNSFSESIGALSTVEEIYQFVIKEISKLFNVDIAFIYLLNKEDNFELGFSLPEACHELNHSFPKLKYELFRDEELWHLIKNPLQDGDRIYSIPLVKGNRTYGILGVIQKSSSEDNDLNKEDWKVFHQIGLLVSLVVINKRIQRRYRFAFDTFSKAKYMGGRKDIYQFIVNRFCSSSSKFNAAMVHLFDDVKGNLYGFVSAGIDVFFKGSSRLEVGQTVIGNVFSSGKREVVSCESFELPYRDWAAANGFMSMICYPITDTDEAKVGTFSLFTKYPFTVDNEEDEFFEMVVSEMAELSDKINYEKKIEKLSSSDDIVSEIISMDKTTSQLLEILLREILKDLHGDIGFISLFSKTSDTIQSVATIDISGKYPSVSISDELTVSHDTSLTAYVIRSKKAYLYPSDTNIDALYVPYKGVPEGTIKCELLVPMMYEQQVIGIIVLSSSRAHNFDSQDLEFLQTTANKAAQVIQNRVFYDANKALVEHPIELSDEKAICQHTAEMTSKVLSTSMTIIWILKKDESGEYLSAEGIHSVKNAESTPKKIPKSPGLLEWAIIDLAKNGSYENERNGFYLPDLSENRFINAKMSIKLGLKSMFCMPIVNGREVIGLVSTFTNRRYDLFGTELVLLGNIANRCASSIANSRLNERNEILRDKWATTNVLANPGIVALSFVHDITHITHYLNRDLDLLEDAIPKNLKSSDTINLILDSLTEHTNSLRKSFSSLVRIGKQTKTKKKPSSVREILDDVAHLFNKRFKDMNIDFEYELEGGDVSVVCYPNEIEQVIVNMLLNSIFAFRSVSHRRKRIAITTSHATSDKGEQLVRIEVYDNGPGISEENLTKIYSPDFSTKGEEGSGFGLTICKRIVESNHDGTLSHTSKEGEWTRFVIYLPKN